MLQCIWGHLLGTNIPLNSPANTARVDVREGFSMKINISVIILFFRYRLNPEPLNRVCG